MFNKKNDTWLKITNSVLIILSAISLATAIGSHNTLDCYDYNSDNDSLTMTEQEMKYDYQLQCKLTNRINNAKAEQSRYYGLSLFGTSIVTLIIINVFKKREN